MAGGRNFWLGAVPLEWIVYGAIFMEMNGAGNSEDFAEFAMASGMSTHIDHYLNEAASLGGPLLAGWAGEVRRNIAE